MATEISVHLVSVAELEEDKEDKVEVVEEEEEEGDKGEERVGGLKAFLTLCRASRSSDEGVAPGVED